MEIEAVYDNGHIELPRSLRLASKRFPVRIDIPESEIIGEPTPKDTRNQPNYLLPPEAKAMAKEVSERLDHIRKAAPTEKKPPDLTEKQSERIRAFRFREHLRAERDE